MKLTHLKIVLKSGINADCKIEYYIVLHSLISTSYNHLPTKTVVENSISNAYPFTLLCVIHPHTMDLPYFECIPYFERM